MMSLDDLHFLDQYTPYTQAGNIPVSTRQQVNPAYLGELYLY